jgi:hypothetical protein
VRQPVAALAAALLALGAYLAVRPAAAAFTGRGTVAGNQWTTSSLGNPGGLTATRPGCATPTAPTFVSMASKATSGAGGDNVTINRPAAWVAGDVLVAMFVATASVDNSSMTGPAGWSELREGTEGTYLRSAVYAYRLVAPLPASFTFDWNYSGFAGGDVNGGLVITAYRGADPTTPVATSALTSNTGGTVTAPVVATGRPNSIRVFGASAMQVTSMTDPTGMSRRQTMEMDQNGFFVNDAYVGVWDETVAPVGNTPARSTTLNGGGHSWHGASVIIQPPTDPTVQLSWTAAADTKVTGYSVALPGGGTAAVTGRTTVGYTHSGAARTAGTYTVRSVLAGSNWVSTGVSVTAAACP